MENQILSRSIIGAAVEVQRVLGHGLLERAYAAAFARELELQGLSFAREVPIHTNYKDTPIGVGYRADFIVESSVIVELKAVDTLLVTHKAQLLSYLRLSNLKLGLLINFNEFQVTRGVHRVVNNLWSAFSARFPRFLRTAVPPSRRNAHETPDDRQLRQLHLQPGAVLRRTGRAGGGVSQRRDHG
ncbi:GxxExxY protein [Ramlibacter henchirensis]|uniref:GxxExxY protein n=1 Tax=Ramlibacter henchirensis TaxID=204072 RepID=A0A4Z0C928_9BURK|nr:GxxExxY protein [Ramlibacter henchirensis]TFZ06605.1 GxxExxY protein [Ramlibacter henchirensis]